MGAAAAFSFFPTKVMTTFEGGMLTTDDPHEAELARSRPVAASGEIPSTRADIVSSARGRVEGAIPSVLGPRAGVRSPFKW